MEPFKIVKMKWFHKRGSKENAEQRMKDLMKRHQLNPSVCEGLKNTMGQAQAERVQKDRHPSKRCRGRVLSED